MIRRFSMILAAGALSSCNSEPAPPPSPKPTTAKLPHCFFKATDAKDIKLAVKDDLLIVSGRFYRSDGRYKADFLKPEVDGGVAVLRPTITVNDTGFSAPDNWWDIKASIPAAGIKRVEVRCGKSVLATLQVDRPTG
jgi:hypothetical protein